MSSDPYADLYFTKEQLVLSQEQAFDVARDFWNVGSLTSENLTDIDRAFIQRALLIAVDMSDKAGFLFSVYSSAVNASVKQSVQDLVKDVMKEVAGRWFKKRFGHDKLKINAVGKAGVRYSAMTTEWQMRVSMGDPAELTNYLIAG